MKAQEDSVFARAMNLTEAQISTHNFFEAKGRHVIRTSAVAIAFQIALERLLQCARIFR
jgi:hypothetical protein